MAGKKLGLSDLLGKPNRYREYRPNTTWVLPNQCTGVEIEVEGVRPEVLQKWEMMGNHLWKYKEDHSLRDNGMEFITTDGLFGEDLFQAIDSFYGFISKNRLKWHPSDRTGIHIHLDVTDLELNTTFRNFIATYMIFERPLFDFIGDERRNNIFCLPLYKAQADLHVVGKMFDQKMTQDGFAYYIGQLNRYAALNLNALNKYGTVEFRHMRTTMNPEKLIDWINLLMCIKKFAREYPGTHLELMALAEKDTDALAAAVFGKRYVVNALHTTESFARDCVEGIGTAKDAFILFKPARNEELDPEAQANNDWPKIGLQRRKVGLAQKYLDRHDN